MRKPKGKTQTLFPAMRPPLFPPYDSTQISPDFADENHERATRTPWLRNLNYRRKSMNLIVFCSAYIFIVLHMKGRVLLFRA
jgi:hypothetical protein